MSDTKVSVTITNRAPGVQPPVYVAGSFSKPEWVPEPMEYTTGEDGIHTFTKTLEVEPESKIVYKFRVGEGDWWLLNEDAPTVTDDLGNRNNILEAPKAPTPEKHAGSATSAVEPESTQFEEPSRTTAENTLESHTDAGIEHPKPIPHVEALQHSEETNQARIGTPEFIQTVTEVSESAALLDRTTPEPANHATNATDEKKEGEPASTTLVPDAADTAAEVADTAARLDPTTPEPEHDESEGDVAAEVKNTPSEVAAEVADVAEKLDADKSAEAPSEVAAEVADVAEKLEADKSAEAPSEVAAQVADTAEKLDADKSAEAPSEVAADVADVGEKLEADKSAEAPSEVAAQVADTAEKLDDEKSVEPPSELAARVADTAEKLDAKKSVEAPSEVAAQVADTAEELDSKRIKAPSNASAQVPDTAETPDDKDKAKARTDTVKSLADIRAGTKDESLDIAGFSNDAEPVPLFAHECAGLYENDEIPGATKEEETKKFFNDDKEDFDDPTLEKFPSSRDAIISTVRKVGSGLNVDQVAVGDAPHSPVAHARSSPQSEDRSESASSPGQASRDLHSLPVPLSLTTSNECSLSATSLQSIAEDGEGAEEEDKHSEPQKDLGDVVERSNGIDEAGDKSEPEIMEHSKANEVAPIVEQAETAEEVIEAAHQVGGEQSKEIDSTGQDLPSVDDVPVASIDSIVELPSATEHLASPDDLPPSVQDIASVVETNGHQDAGVKELDAESEQGAKATDTEPVDREAEAGNGDVEAAKKVDEQAAPVTLKPSLEHLVTIPSPAVAPNTNLKSPASDDDEAVVVKSVKGEESTKSGYLTPERAATPQPEEPGSPREPAPNTADPVAQADLESDSLKTEPVASRSVPPSPQITLSKPNETQPEEELLPAATLDGIVAQEAKSPTASGEAKDDEASRDISNEEGQADVQAPGARQNDNASHGSDGAESGGSAATPSAADESEDPSAQSQSKHTAVTSATEGSQMDGLKQRAIGRPDPVDRSTTPKSIPESHKEAVKGGNWFSSFLRLIFIDFFGGLLRKLSGGDRRTLVTAAVVLGAVGYASWARLQ